MICSSIAYPDGEAQSIDIGAVYENYSYDCLCHACYLFHVSHRLSKSMDTMESHGCNIFL